MEAIALILGLIVILYFARRMDQIKALLEEIRDAARPLPEPEARTNRTASATQPAAKATIPGIND